MDSDLRCTINVNTITHNATQRVTKQSQFAPRVRSNFHIINKSLNDLKAENITNYFRDNPLLLFQHDLYTSTDLFIIRFLFLYYFHFNFS